jgi:hypothetical protein
MTREEAIKALKWFKEYDGGDYDGGDYDGGDRIIDKYGDCYYLVTERDFEAFDMAIKALQQESILEKIRAEIVDLGRRTMNDNRASGIWACRDIIDKYKAESEGA